MGFKMKGFPMHESASALKQVQTQSSPMKVAGGTFIHDYATGDKKQVSNIEADNLKKAQDELDKYIASRDPGEPMTTFDMKNMDEIYAKYGLSYQHQKGQNVEYTGLDKYTNPSSPDYDENIKTEEDLDEAAGEYEWKVDEQGEEILDEYGQRIFISEPKDMQMYKDSQYEGHEGYKESVTQKELDREAEMKQE